MGKNITPGPQERRFAAYIEGLAEAAGHADRNVPLKNYCTALLLPGERKSVAQNCLRCYGYGVPNLDKALSSAENRLKITFAFINAFLPSCRRSLRSKFLTSHRRRLKVAWHACWEIIN